MKKDDNLIKFSGGIAIMFSVFLLLVVATKVSDNKELYARLIRGNNNSESSLLEDKIIKGTFNNLDYNGDVIMENIEDNSKIHYKSLISSKLSNEKLNPVLKLEINENGINQWQQIDWNWIDFKQGALFFHYSTEKNNALEPVSNFTGKYQIILE